MTTPSQSTEYPLSSYRTALRRIAASIFDGIILAIPLLVVSANTDINEENSAGLHAIGVVLPILYSVLMHFRYGQTLGKMAFGIKVINVDGSHTITLRQAMLRDSVWILFEIIGLFSIGGVLTASAGLWWAILEIVTMLTNSKRRAAHDFIAGTVVLKVKGADSAIA